ncbi:nitrite reductase (NAD(P)H) small subunit family protein [Arthrobacter sp. 35W]|uniref:nitrite reductase (NAD(P)H) small subunit family protein n=1 Tax=Arthrobacter sp. 35W TaxID=1132441 RepID=UPI0004077B3D|nr:nitrite reductase (NAD(P)H) small subunit family protein [Arthrobacter sp. 35W]
MTAVVERPAAQGSTDVQDSVNGTPQWQRICALSELEASWGEAAFVGGRQIALFRVGGGAGHIGGVGTGPADAVFAVDQADPATGACVMARGIVGSRGGQATVASPLHKEVYALATGECLSGSEHRLPVHPVRVVDGFIEVEV